MLRHGILLVALLTLTACVTSMGWTQEGKTDQDRKRDDGECRAQANVIGRNNAFTVNHAYGECMEGRGWTKAAE